MALRTWCALLASVLLIGQASGQDDRDAAVLDFPDAAFVVAMDQTGIGPLSGGEDAVVARSPVPGSEHPLAILSGVRPDAGAGGASGIHLRLPDMVEQAASGRAMRVTVVARRPPDASNAAFAVSYSTNEVGNSSWRRFELADELAAYSFTFDINPMDRGAGDFVGILPDPDGTGGAVEVAAIAVEPMDRVPQQPDQPVAGAEPVAPTRQNADIVSTAFYDVAVRHVGLPPPGGQRGAIAKIGSGIIYGSQKGRLFYIADLDNATPGTAIELDKPLPFDLSSPLLARFRPETLSILDVAVEENHLANKNKRDLYVSYLSFDETRECVYIELSRAILDITQGTPSFASEWTRVYASEPCLPIEPMTHEASFFETGGRIDFDLQGVLLAVGLGSFRERHEATSAFAQLNGYDYGKIIRIHRHSLEKSVVSKGHRNPQGLYVDLDGTIFETEHGPQGGDEVNIIREGHNYGWPAVTLGTQYGERVWILSEEQGQHNNYEMPLFAFTPAVAVSQIIRTRSKQFPIWNRNLLVASLNEQTLFRLHYADGRIILVEPVPLGTRLRDMVELEDGRIVLLTDGARLLVLSNPDHGEPQRADVRAVEPEVRAEVTAVDRRVLSLLIANAKSQGDPARGGDLFWSSCSSCHTLEGESEGSIGPSLACAFGGHVATTDQFGYSTALARLIDRLWTGDNLEAFLENPAAWAPGTRMAPVPFASEADRRDVIAFLAAMREQKCSR